MKKKFTLLLLVLLMAPIVALFGCGEVSSYTIDVSPSSDPLGQVYGSDTYSEGDTVTLTAIAIDNAHFVAWVKEGTTIVESGDTFKIVNTQRDNGDVSKSVLTFSASSVSTGNYIAVFYNDKLTFAENRMTFVKFESLRFTTTPTADPTDVDDASDLLSATYEIGQGNNLTNLAVAASQTESVAVKDNVNIEPDKVTQILDLTSLSQNVKLTTTISYDDTNFSNLQFRAVMSYKQSSPSVTSYTKVDGYLEGKTYYTYSSASKTYTVASVTKDTDFSAQNYYIKSVEYSAGKYVIIFNLGIDTTTPIYAVLTYTALQ